MLAKGETRHKLEHVPVRLEEEFPEEPADRIEREVDVVSDELLRRAGCGRSRSSSSVTASRRWSRPSVRTVRIEE